MGPYHHASDEAHELSLFRIAEDGNEDPLASSKAQILGGVIDHDIRLISGQCCLLAAHCISRNYHVLGVMKNAHLKQ